MAHQTSYYMLLAMGAILRSKTKSIYGGELLEKGMMASGTLYPLLRRMKRMKILATSKECGDPGEMHRPLRLYYRLTEKGERYARRYHAEVIASNPPLVPFDKFK